MEKEHERKITLGPVTGRGLQNGKCVCVEGGGGSQVLHLQKGERIFTQAEGRWGGGGDKKFLGSFNVGHMKNETC